MAFLTSLFCFPCRRRRQQSRADVKMAAYPARPAEYDLSTAVAGPPGGVFQGYAAAAIPLEIASHMSMQYSPSPQPQQQQQQPPPRQSFGALGSTPQSGTVERYGQPRPYEVGGAGHPWGGDVHSQYSSTRAAAAAYDSRQVEGQRGGYDRGGGGGGGGAGHAYAHADPRETGREAVQYR